MNYLKRFVKVLAILFGMIGFICSLVGLFALSVYLGRHYLGVHGDVIGSFLCSIIIIAAFTALIEDL